MQKPTKTLLVLRFCKLCPDVSVEIHVGKTCTCTCNSLFFGYVSIQIRKVYNRTFSDMKLLGVQRPIRPVDLHCCVVSTP